MRPSNSSWFVRYWLKRLENGCFQAKSSFGGLNLEYLPAAGWLDFWDVLSDCSPPQAGSNSEYLPAAGGLDFWDVLSDGGPPQAGLIRGVFACSRQAWFLQLSPYWHQHRERGSCSFIHPKKRPCNFSEALIRHNWVCPVVGYLVTVPLEASLFIIIIINIHYQ